jgi:hypothetical protein
MMLLATALLNTFQRIMLLFCDLIPQAFGTALFFSTMIYNFGKAWCALENRLREEREDAMLLKAQEMEAAILGGGGAEAVSMQGLESELAFVAEGPHPNEPPKGAATIISC